MDKESDDKVWQMLGAARPVRVNPQFAAGVLRRIRLEEKPRESRVAALLRFAFPVFAACGIAFVLIFGEFLGGEESSAPLAWQESALLFSAGESGVSIAEFAEVAGLDGLVSASAGWEWDAVAPGFP